MLVPEKLNNHYIICGFSRISRGICYKLSEENIPFLIIDDDDNTLSYAKLRDYPLINDDPTNDATLIAAGIEQAKGLVACCEDDSVNLFITLAGRELNPNIHIIICCNDPEIEHRMISAGADNVVYPERLGGVQIAKAALSGSGKNCIKEVNLSNTGVLGYSIEVYEHFDDNEITVNEIINKTSAVNAVGIINLDGTVVTDFSKDEKAHKSVILIINSNAEKTSGETKNKQMKWSSLFSVGIVSIDKEHKNIVDLINKLEASSVRGTARESISQIFDDLFDYTVHHFTHEEKLFDTYNYPDKEKHKKIHIDILNKVKELNKDSKHINVESVSAFLRGWIKHHFCVVDQNYSKFLIEKGVK